MSTTKVRKTASKGKPGKKPKVSDAKVGQVATIKGKTLVPASVKNDGLSISDRLAILRGASDGTDAKVNKPTPKDWRFSACADEWEFSGNEKGTAVYVGYSGDLYKRFLINAEGFITFCDGGVIMDGIDIRTFEKQRDPENDLPGTPPALLYTGTIEAASGKKIKLIIHA